MKFLLLATLACIPLQAQVGIGTITPNDAALLELNATNKGLLLSQVALNATNVTTPYSTHIAGLVVYNTATAGVLPNNVTPGMYYNNGTSWVRMTTKLPALGDIKNGFQSADHDGWYLLNGRALTSLPTVARTNAGTLGYTSNLTDAQDRFLKSKTGAEAVNSVAGTTSFTVSQANLPNVNFTGTTSSAGVHTHTYTDNDPTTRNYASGTSNPLANASEGYYTTESGGEHTHALSFSSGGSGTAVNFVPSHLVVNIFVYLGE